MMPFNEDAFLTALFARDQTLRNEDRVVNLALDAARAAYVPPVARPVVEVQRVDERLRNGTLLTTFEVVDSRRPKSQRVRSSHATEAAARGEITQRPAFYGVPILGGAYTLGAVDADEYFHDTDYELLGNVHLYGVLSGCGLTYDAADMTVDLAAGEIIHNGGYVAVAAAANTYTLVADGTNERWAALCLSSAGTAVLVSGDAAASSSVEPSKPEIGDRVLLAMVKIQAGQTVANNCEQKVDKHLRTHTPAPIFNYKTATQDLTDTTFVDVTGAAAATFTYAAVANGVYVADYFLPVSFASTGGLKVQFTTPAAPTGQTVSYEASLLVSTSPTDNLSAAIMRPVGSPNADAVGTTLATDAGKYYNAATNAVRIRHTFRNGANAGNVTLQAAQNSDVGTTTLGAGCTMSVSQVE